MATRKKAPRPIGELLAKELPGETPPSAEDLALAVRASLGFAIIEPWLLLSDGHLFAFDSDSGQRWYCTVMGQLGQVYGLQAFRGDAGFALFDDIQHDRVGPEGFLSRQDLFTVEFVRRVELTPVDRAIAALSPVPIPAGQRVPQITVSRPRQLRWYPNAAELEEINDGLMASLLFFDWLAQHKDVDPWVKNREMPLVVMTDPDLEVRQIPFPALGAPPADPPVKLDERAVNQILTTLAKRKVGPPIEVDVFLFRAPVGGDGRPFFPCAALACDAESGFLFPPVMGDLEETPAQALVKCVLNALRASPFRPIGLCVANETSLAVLAPLAQVLDLPLSITKIPMLQEARAALEARLG